MLKCTKKYPRFLWLSLLYWCRRCCDCLRRWELDALWRRMMKLDNSAPNSELQFHPKSTQATTTFTRTGIPVLFSLTVWNFQAVGTRFMLAYQFSVAFRSTKYLCTVSLGLYLDLKFYGLVNSAFNPSVSACLAGFKWGSLTCIGWCGVFLWCKCWWLWFVFKGRCSVLKVFS